MAVHVGLLASMLGLMRKSNVLENGWKVGRLKFQG